MRRLRRLLAMSNCVSSAAAVAPHSACLTDFVFQQQTRARSQHPGTRRRQLSDEHVAPTMYFFLLRNLTLF